MLYLRCLVVIYSGFPFVSFSQQSDMLTDDVAVPSLIDSFRTLIFRHSHVFVCALIEVFYFVQIVAKESIDIYIFCLYICTYFFICPLLTASCGGVRRRRKA